MGNNNIRYTWDEIKSHENWIVIEGNVYDLTNLYDLHPAGRKIFENLLGNDATYDFNLFHGKSLRIRKKLKEYYIGKLKNG